MTRVPRDLVGRVPLKIDAVELAPEVLLAMLGHRVEAQLLRGFAAARFEAILQRRCAGLPGELGLRGAKQILE